MKLNAMIHKEEDMFVAECPEIGTVSQGKTKKEALANLKEATELYLEEFPIEKKITVFKAKFDVTPNVKTSEIIRA